MVGHSLRSTGQAALQIYEYLVVVPYQPQANGLAERRMEEVMKIEATIFQGREKMNNVVDFHEGNYVI